MAQLDEGQLTQLRTHPHRAKFYLGVHLPRYLCVLIVNKPDAQRGDRVIPYDTLTWLTKPGGGVYDYTDVQPGMTLYVEDGSPILTNARVRIKSCTATEITVASNEHINWQDDIYMWIANVHEPWYKWHRVQENLAEVDLDIWMDYDEEYVDQASACKPVAIMGPPAAAFMDAGVGTVYFDGSQSYGLNGATITSYSWEFPGGTPSDSSAPTPGNVTWDTTGHYMVALTVTDSNGKTHTGYRWVAIYDSRTGEGYWTACPYIDFEVTSLEGNYQDGGWRASFVVRDRWLRTRFAQIYDNAQVMVFAEGEAGAGSLPIPGNHPNRSSLLFVGWIVGETIEKNPHTGEVRFEAQGICGRMAFIDQPTTFLETPASGPPAKWFQASNLTVDLALALHLHWYSTILDITDVHLTGNNAKTIFGWAFPEASLYQQCQQLLDCIIARMVADKQSCIWCRIDPNVLPIGERGGIDTLFTLADTDWGRGSLLFERRPLDDVSQLDLSGIYHDGGGEYETNRHPIISLAPGTYPGPEGRYLRVEGLCLEGQAQANQLSGDLLQWKNNPYPSISMPMAGMWTPIDVGPPEWIQWTIADTYTKRGFAWTNARFIARRVRINILNAQGTATVDIELEKEADGPDGITAVYPPTEPTEPTGPVPYPPPTPPAPPIPGPTPGAWRKHVITCGSGGCYWTNNWVLGSGPSGVPDWNQANNGLGSDYANASAMVFHPYTPETCHYLQTATGFYRRDDLYTGTWALKLHRDTVHAAVGIGDVGVFRTCSTNPVYPEHVYVIYSCGSIAADYVWFCKSTDRGNSWSYYKIGGPGFYYQPGGDLQFWHQTPGTIAYLSQWFGGVLGGYRVWKTEDQGHTWARKCTCGDIAANHIAYVCPVNSDRVYSMLQSGGLFRVAISTDGGVTFPLVPQQAGGWYVVTPDNLPGKHWANAQLLAAGLVRVWSGAYCQKSLNYGVTWTRVETADNLYQRLDVVPDAVEKLYIWRAAGAPKVGATQDEGATIYSKVGTGGTALVGTVKDLQPIWTLP